MHNTNRSKSSTAVAHWARHISRWRREYWAVSV